MEYLEIDLESQEWYERLVDDCKSIITDAVLTSRWALVEGYWNLGKRIREDDNVKKIAKNTEKNIDSIYSGELTHLLQDLGVKIGVSKTTLWYTLQFYDKYPDLNALPEGKNITWNKLITKYLPQHKKEIIILPKGKWNVLYADPPWEYGEKGVYVAVDIQYPTMSISELCRMKVKDIVADNAVLFLWVTSPILPECFPVVDAWGFKYKASFVWDKVLHNWGHYNSVRHEFLLVCIKGAFLPEGLSSHDSVVSIKRTGRHSEKPVYFRDEIIEKMYPHGKKIELFARYDKEKAEELTKRGWVLWGSEIPENQRD